MIAKAGLGLVGLGAIGIGGVAFVKPEWLGINKEIPWSPLSADQGYKDGDTNDPYKDKFGSTYKNYLVGVVGKETDFNKGMWEKLFEELKKKPPTRGKFKYELGDGTLVKEAHGTDGKSLNKVCETAYKASETNDFGTGDGKFNKEQVWKYCSPIGAEPKAINKQSNKTQEYGTATSSIGKAKEAELLSIHDKDNEKLWKLKNDEFFGLGIFNTGTTKTAPSEKFFEKLFSGDDKGPNALKNRCAAAYKLTSETGTISNAEQTSETEVLKYCSIKSIK